jgi:hypothetical protein
VPSTSLATSVRVPVAGSPSFGLGGTGVHAPSMPAIRSAGSSGAAATSAAVSQRRAVASLSNTAALASSVASALAGAASSGVAADSFHTLLGSAAEHGAGHGSGSAEGGAGAVEGFHLRGPQPRSSYQYDVGGSDAEGPAHRPTHDPVGSGLYTTTRDLLGGTTRQSKHVPGVGLHIPSTTFGHAGEHGLGQTVHDSFHSKTNLSETFNIRMPGFGGHKPTQAPDTAPEAQLIKGQFAPTETLRADHLIHSYWEARKAAGAAR